MDPLIFAFMAFMLLAYWYLTRNFAYWRHRGINGPKPIIGFGTIFAKMFRPMNELEVEWNRTYGKIYGLFLGNEPVLTVAEPELVKDILIKDFHNFVDRRRLTTYHEIINLNLFFVLGKQWKRIRATVSPSFSNHKLKSMYGLMEKCVTNTIHFLESQITSEGSEVNMKRVLGNLTMDVIAKSAFATEIQCNIETNNAFLVNATKFFNFNPIRYLAAFLLPQWLLRFLVKSQFDESANQFFINISRHIIEERKAKNICNNDLIQLLIDAEYKDKHNQSQKLSENEILAQCWVIFLAGYETTSTTLSFALYELALNPELQDKLFRVVQKATNRGLNFSFEIINKIDYLEAVINETLRKYPPLIRLERTAEDDYQLSNTDLTIQAGHVVEIPIYAMHHDPNNFPEPERFWPDRFMPHNSDNLKPYTFIPFGSGSRNCVGMKFALEMEIKLALSRLISRFQFGVAPKTQIPIRFKPVTPFLATDYNYLKVNLRKQQSSS